MIAAYEAAIRKVALNDAPKIVTYLLSASRLKWQCNSHSMAPRC